MQAEDYKRIGHWLKTGDVGASSKALCAATLGAIEFPLPVPGDCWDFGRCIGYMNLLPESERIRTLDAISTNSKRWRNIKDNWAKLEELYNSAHADEFNKFLSTLTTYDSDN